MKLVLTVWPGIELGRLDAESAELTSLLGLLHRALDIEQPEPTPQTVVDSVVKAGSRWWTNRMFR